MSMDDIAKLATTLQEAAALKPHLDKKGSVERAIKEAEARLKTSRDEEVALEKRIEDLKVEAKGIETQLAEHQKALDDAEPIAVRNAQAKAKKVIEDAQTIAADMITKAQSRADEIDAGLITGRAKLDALNGAIATKQEAHAAIIGKLKQVQSHIEAL